MLITTVPGTCGRIPFLNLQLSGCVLSVSTTFILSFSLMFQEASLWADPTI